MNAKVTTAIFLALLLGIAALNLLTPESEKSESENRYLQTRPAFSVQSLVRGKYTADFDTWITDQFVARDAWVGLKTATEYAVGRRGTNKVYFGKDGYLMETFDTINGDSYARNLDYVCRFSEITEEELGIPVEVMLVPSSSGVLTDKLPAFAPELDQRELLHQADEALPHLVDVMEVLTAHKGEPIYYKTDHHWTSLGAFYAYNAWREFRGEVPRPLESYTQEVLSDEFYGTTWSKARLYTVRPDTITAYHDNAAGRVSVDYNLGASTADSIYERSYLDVKDKYSVFLNANQPISIIQTGVENGRRLLLIKDSYANTFVQMLLGDYQEIVVVDLRYYREPAAEIIQREGITDVLVLYSLSGFAAEVNLMFLVQ